MLKILIVDDEHDLLKLFKLRLGMVLKKYPHEIRTAESGEACLKILSEMNVTNDPLLLITDINMPQMSGFELIAKTKALYPDIFAYVCTAYDTPEYEKQSKLEGAMRFFTKPLNYERLGQAIATDFKIELSASTH